MLCCRRCHVSGDPVTRADHHKCLKREARRGDYPTVWPSINNQQSRPNHGQGEQEGTVRTAFIVVVEAEAAVSGTAAVVLAVRARLTRRLRPRRRTGRGLSVWSENSAASAPKLQVAHTRLWGFIALAYLLETTTCCPAFQVLGGLLGRGIFNKMKSAVDRIGFGSPPCQLLVRGDRQPLSVGAGFCNPASGWGKQSCELRRNVKARSRALTYL